MAMYFKETERPKPLREFVVGKPVWIRAFFAIEWALRWAAHLLGNWALLEVLEYIGSFSILAAVILYFAGSHDRTVQKHYQAWQVINTAQGKGGSGGRVDALQDLNEDHVPLVGVDLSDAFLQNLQLPGAQLQRSNFRAVDARGANLAGADLMSSTMTSANLRGAKLTNAKLEDSDLSNADLAGANLSAASLNGTDFSDAELTSADLMSISHWSSIKSIKNANIAGVSNAPSGFVQWAIAHGAVQRSTTRP